MDLALRILDDAAKQYIVDAIRGCDTFLKFVADIVATQQGQVFTFTREPSEWSYRRVADFTCGGRSDRSISLRLVSEYICERFREPQGIFLVENSTARAEDKWLYQPESTQIFLYESVVYHFELLENTSPALIKEAIGSGENAGLPVCCVVSSMSPEWKAHLTALPPHFLAEKEAALLAQNARAVVLGAYDGEGYLFWEKTPIRRFLAMA